MELVHVDLVPGVVYILRSDALKDTIVKIGMTTRSSEKRAWELAGASGVPTQFEVLYEEHVANCEQAEFLIHRALARYRIRRDREFFDVPLKIAVRTVFEVGLLLNQSLLKERSRLVIYASRLPKNGAATFTELLPRSPDGMTAIRLSSIGSARTQT
jgi:T5orf172 domain